MRHINSHKRIIMNFFRIMNECGKSSCYVTCDPVDGGSARRVCSAKILMRSTHQHFCTVAPFRTGQYNHYEYYTDDHFKARLKL